MLSLKNMLRDLAWRLSLIADYPISVKTYPLPGADGTTGEWTETKWANGKMELVGRFPWRAATLTSNMTTGVYSSNYWRTVRLTFPNEFVESPKSWINPQTNGYTHAEIAQTTVRGAAFRMWQSYSATLSEGYVDVLIVGKWR